MKVPKYKAVDIKTGNLINVISLSSYSSIVSEEVYGTMINDQYEESTILRYIDDVILLSPTGFNGISYNDIGDGTEEEVYRGDIISITWTDLPMGFYREHTMTGVVEYDKSRAGWVLRNCVYYDEGEDIPDEVDGISISVELPDEEDLEEVLLSNFDLDDTDSITILSNIYLDKDFDYGFK